jgi:peptide deformylase
MWWLMEILQWPSTELRRVAEPVTPAEAETPEFADKVKDLAATLVKHGGWALAATQCGWRKAVVVTVHPNQLAEIGARADNAVGSWQLEIVALFNPRILAKRGGTQKFPEGCLSFRGGGVELIDGYSDVDVEADDLGGDLLHHVGTLRYVSLAARVVCHEVDHLNGKLMIDRMGKTQKHLFLKRLAAYQKKQERAA